ncbi:hypothetical protein NDU88_007121 [Pleurodeles waltl]|uniref:Uncharacterized protein n=1 Tax=Pleurodeles waltl TaxID=8319 RepID=A0AAV7WG54_PLEWA|nr:hypothetical protein NDU88_007121 [Pleurodeles waltl]
MPQSLSRALAVSVAQKINQAVLADLKPLTQQIECFVKKQGLVPLTDDKLTDEGPLAPANPTPQTSSWPHDGAMSTLTQSSSDHVYCSLPSFSKGSSLEAAVSSVSDLAASDSSHSSSPLRNRKRARKSGSSHVKERPKSPSNPFQFNLEDIIHPRSADWAPAADYLNDKLRKGFDKEVQNSLRAECPRPEIPDKVAETPDIDPSMLTLLKKFPKDPKKGIDRAWRSCQDKLLDLSGNAPGNAAGNEAVRARLPEYKEATPSRVLRAPNSRTPVENARAARRNADSAIVGRCRLIFL